MEKQGDFSSSRNAGGMEIIDFMDVNNTLRIEKMGGLQFVLQCSYNEITLSQKLSKFHQQVLNAAKLYFIHNFSPHRTIIWNNEFITRKNKSGWK